MSNMSHCRFENTFLDLRDCQDAVKNDTELTEMSNREQQAFVDLILVARELAESYEDFDEIQLREWITQKQSVDVGQ